MDQIVERAKRGDKAALEELLAKVAPSVHRFGLRMCRNKHDAEDVLQDTLLSVAMHLPQFEERSSLSSWVFAIARSACARRRRGAKNQPADGDESLVAQPDSAPSPEANAQRLELSSTLNKALASLTPDYREVIVLRDMEDLSAPETAAALGVTVDAVKSRLHRAREALRTALRPTLEPTSQSSARCPNVALLWSRKLEGDLSQADCAAMERHILTCADCAGACDALKTALGACKQVATSDVPPEVQARVRAAMRLFAEQTLSTTPHGT